MSLHDEARAAISDAEDFLARHEKFQQNVALMMAPPGALKGDEDELREQPWFNLVQPWEREPTRGRRRGAARRRWRDRHVRIFRLEKELGIIDSKWRERDLFPWLYYTYEGW